jgi:ATP-dependent DNA helicase 2 subunit 2
MIEFEEPGVYNDFIRELKSKLLRDELGGGRKDLWFQVTRERKLGLIDRETAPASDVSEEEAASVCISLLSIRAWANKKAVLFHEAPNRSAESC